MHHVLHHRSEKYPEMPDMTKNHCASSKIRTGLQIIFKCKWWKQFWKW